MNIFLLLHFHSQPNIVSDVEEKKEEKPEDSVEEKKVLPELEKYWKAVNDDPTNFTGWTYLLQYVDMEVIEMSALYFNEMFGDYIAVLLEVSLTLSFHIFKVCFVKNIESSGYS